jgi:hypothetical protein
MRWHRAGFRRYWRWKSCPRGGRPQIDIELRALIRRMSIESSFLGNATHPRHSGLNWRSRVSPSTWSNGEGRQARNGGPSCAAEARKAFRSSHSKAPLTEYEKEQMVLCKNLERLKAERLAREAAKPKND